MGQFYYAAKAFDTLERLDPHSPEYNEGKRGACFGVFQLVIAGMEARESLADVVHMLRSNQLEMEKYGGIIRRWAAEKGISVPG